MSCTVAKTEIGDQEAYFTIEFRFNSGRTEPSDISGLPRSQIYRFGAEELMGWCDMTEEDAVEIIDSIMEKIDNGRSRQTQILANGCSFTIKQN